MSLPTMVLAKFIVVFMINFVTSEYINYKAKIGCNSDYQPDNCANPTLASMTNVEDFERCALAQLAKPRRNFFWGTSGRGLTYQANLDAFKRITILPRAMRNVSRPDLSTVVLGQKVAFPIGLAPLPAQKLAQSSGEVATVSAAIKAGTIVIVSCLSTTSIEEISETIKSATQLPENLAPNVWMHTYFFKNRQLTLNIANTALQAGFKAIVVDISGTTEAGINCQNNPPVEGRLLRFPIFGSTDYDPSLVDTAITFQDITWLKRSTKAKIIVMGVLTGDDAVRAVRAGASAVIVSNIGGRQLDGSPATIEALPRVVAALRQRHPRAEVYLDGGIRNGYDVFKALARGAKAVFVGRPIAWGLTIGSEEGVSKILTILQRELNETMLFSGILRTRGINAQTIFPKQSPYGF